jgi:hypothetical protein
MAWKVCAVLLLVVSLVGAIVRIRDGDYIYLSASLIGLGVALWLWNKGDEGPARANGEGASD